MFIITYPLRRTSHFIALTLVLLTSVWFGSRLEAVRNDPWAAGIPPYSFEAAQYVLQHYLPQDLRTLVAEVDSALKRLQEGRSNRS